MKRPEPAVADVLPRRYHCRTGRSRGGLDLDERDLLTLACWLAGLALMMWRSPDGARLPWSTAVLGAAAWCALPLWEPSLRTAWHFGLTSAFLWAGLARRWSRPAASD